ncbi:hypothetical protein PCARR_a0997 [Pseudoalteromonas carrageenovora IAM 12662]|uniref:Uncharacterized protein n=1 Tax=Pseudoalteromonas carrageenovora IAM 12662 TaxID=1314868 RepID=A0ABR9EQ05_PSEVC|nr:hypothetical protein [Pseudoalteromonas carrageenovora IAM 12662]
MALLKLRFIFNLSTRLRLQKPLKRIKCTLIILNNVPVGAI